jgi:indole-3-glycerol phosphate synthase
MESKKPIFIAEIKTKSPFGFQSPHSFHKLMECAIEYGDWISVHDNALWGGDFETIAFVRKFTTKPILAKGLHTTNDDIDRAIDHGATTVLVVDKRPTHYKYIDHCLFELHSVDYAKAVQQCFFAQHSKQMKFVCNSRDLRTGGTRNVNELDAYLKMGNWVCQASNIAKPDDVNPNVNAFIVGTNLIEYCKQL